MSRRRRPWQTFRRSFTPDAVPERLFDLLFAWAEWRSTVGCPRSIRIPQEGYTFAIAGGAVVATHGPAFTLIPSTAPREPGRLMEFNQAFAELAEDQRFYILAVIEYNSEPWLKGEKWQSFLKELAIEAKDYARLLADALRSLTGNVKRRGLL